MNYQPVKTPAIDRTFILDDVVRDDLLKALNITTDAEGYLTYSENNERALSMNGREIRKDEFAGVIKGSTLLMRSDVDSLISVAEQLVEQK